MQALATQRVSQLVPLRSMDALARERTCLEHVQVCADDVVQTQY